MYIKNDDLVVAIDDTIFRARPYLNPQFVLDEDALVGFYDGVNVKRTETPRPNQWGDFSEPGLLNSRRMSLTGSAIADTPAELHKLRDKFTSLLQDGTYTEISVQNSSGTRFINVALDGHPSWVQKIDTVAVWKLDLYAPDPRMYGVLKERRITDLSISGGVDYPMDYPLDYGGSSVTLVQTVSNAGNSDAWPIFRITGDYFAGFTLTNNAGKLIKYDGMVTMTSPVYIDTAKGVATQGGVDKTTLLSIRDWFSIPPNTEIQPVFSPHVDAAGWCDIMFRDTWI